MRQQRRYTVEFRAEAVKSALAHARAEYLKLRRSLRDGSIFDLLTQCVARYIERKTASTMAAWRFNHRLRTLPAGKRPRAAAVRWSADEWHTTHDTFTNIPSWDCAPLTFLQTSWPPVASSVYIQADRGRPLGSKNSAVQVGPSGYLAKPAYDTPISNANDALRELPLAKVRVIS